VLPRLEAGSIAVAFISIETLLSKMEPPLANLDISRLSTALYLLALGFFVGDTAFALYGDLYRFLT